MNFLSTNNRESHVNLKLRLLLSRKGTINSAFSYLMNLSSILPVVNKNDLKNQMLSNFQSTKTLLTVKASNANIS